MANKHSILLLRDPINVYGVNDARLNQLKKKFPSLKLVARGNELRVTGEKKQVVLLEQIIKQINESGTSAELFDDNQFSEITEKSAHPDSDYKFQDNEILVFGNNGITVKARTLHQKAMVQSTEKNDLVFAVGPAGSGKTYTAVALAVRALKNKVVRKIILTRPAVEAGEHLGFLPGDLKEKLDPYLQPLYDALYDMLPTDKLQQYLQTNIIQIAPLAFMRGRTLDHAFVILDEAQNATEAQLKMFLTRMGSSAKFIVTGDLTQIDLPKNQPSGLFQAVKLFKKIAGIDFVFLGMEDVIRHRLVRKIIEAYDGK